MSAYGGKADVRELPVECPLTAVKQKSVDGPGPNKAGNLRTHLNDDRQSQLSVASGPGFEPAVVGCPKPTVDGSSIWWPNVQSLHIPRAGLGTATPRCYTGRRRRARDPQFPAAFEARPTVPVGVTTYFNRLGIYRAAVPTNFLQTWC